MDETSLFGSLLSWEFFKSYAGAGVDTTEHAPCLASVQLVCKHR